MASSASQPSHQQRQEARSPRSAARALIWRLAAVGLRHPAGPPQRRLIGAFYRSKQRMSCQLTTISPVVAAGAHIWQAAGAGR